MTRRMARAAALVSAALLACAAAAQAQVVTGSYVGDGTDDRVITGLGFSPAMVIVKGEGATQAVCRTSTMVGDLSKSLTQAEALQPNRIQSFGADGFTVGSDAAVNAAGQTYHWIAFDYTDGEVAIGAYAGNGVDNRNITGLGLRPDYVLIQGDLDETSWHRSAPMLNDFSMTYDKNKAAVDRIQALLVDGFQVGKDSAVNEVGAVYHWIAWRSVPGRVMVGSYIGDGTNDRALTGLGLTPAFVLMKPDADFVGTHRPASLGAADLTLTCDASAGFPGGILSFVSDGFVIGSEDAVNSSGKIFYFAAFAQGFTTDADLRLGQTVAPPAADEGDTVTFTVTVANDGPYAVSSVAVLDPLPSGLEFAGASASKGTYSSSNGIWQIGSLYRGVGATLALAGRVAAGRAGTSLANHAAIFYCDVADPDSSDNETTAAVSVRGADLGLALAVDPLALAEGDSATFTLALRNDGPDTALAVSVNDPLPSGLLFAGAATDAGVYDEVTGIWTVGDLAPGGEAALWLTAVAAAGTDGLEIVNACSVTAAAPVDFHPADNGASTALRVANPAVNARATTLAARAAAPGGAGAAVCRLELSGATAADTLRTLIVSNVTVSEGSALERDAEWAPLRLFLEADGALSPAPTVSPGEGAIAAFADGRAVFGGLDVAVSPGDTTRLVVQGSASLAARDGETLLAAVAGPDDLAFGGALGPRGVWPLVSGGGLVVDGMVAAQARLEPVPAGVLPVGSRRRLALDVVLPANGWAPDRLERLNVKNLGDAVAGTDLELLEAWVDDGDGVCDPAVDTRLGAPLFTGDRWELSGLGVDIPPAGRRLFVTVDVAAGATSGRTVRLALPASSYVAIGMASGNDGPLDRDVANPGALTISADGRVVLTAILLASGPTAPGRRDLPLLQLVATNTDSVSRRLLSLRCANRSTSGAGGGTAQLDGALEQLRLCLDGDDDGVLDDVDVDPLVGTAVFNDGLARFEGLAVDLPPDTARQLFVVGDVSSLRAADGDALGASISGADDVVFEPSGLVAAKWPLDSGGRWTVDGMVALQLFSSPVPAATLGPGDGPALALDIILPGNGYADDVLERLTVVNLGNASPADLGELRLWRDGGDGVFSSGGDDVPLAPLAWFVNAWQTPGLTEPLPAAGTRLFVAVTASETPADSATVRLSVPVGGVTVASANDGPRDVPVASPGSLLLSTAPLLAELAPSVSASTVGQTVEVVMTVRNEGVDDVLGVVPSALGAEGDGILEPTGPAPIPVDIPRGGVATFGWTCLAQGVGEVRLSASAAGVGASDGVIRRSFKTEANPHRVFTPAQELGLYAVTNLPFAILRGQQNVVPLTLTLLNPAGSDAADIRLRGLRVRLESATGAGITPADLLSRVVVSEGTVTYLDRAALETSGDEIDLTLARPALVTTGEPTTISLRLDISPETLVPEFRLVLPDSTFFSAEDAVSGAPVAVRLEEGTYPIQSGLGRVMDAAPALLVAPSAAAQRRVGPGQTEVPLLAIELANPGPVGVAGDVLVSGLALVLADTLGAPLAEPGRWLHALRLRAGTTLLLEREVGALEDTLLALELPTSLTVAAGAPVTLTATADVADDAEAGAFRARLGPADGFEADDRNTGLAVPVLYGAEPVAGGAVLVELQATRLLAAGQAALPLVLTIGARGVTALTMRLEHPGPPLTAAIRCDTVSVVCLDQARRSLAPGVYLDRLRVLCAGAELAALAVAPDAIGPLRLPLGGLVLASEETVDLSLVLDVDALAPVGTLELVIQADGVDARDANLDLPVALEPAAEASLPLSSGVALLQPPADLLRVGLTSRLPTVLAGGAVDVPVAAVLLSNPAPEGAGSVTISALRLRAATRDGASALVGDAVAEVMARLDGQVWAVSAGLAAGDTFAVLVPDDPLEVEAGQTVELALSASLAAAPLLEALRLGLDESDVSVAQPDGALLAVHIEPAGGAEFPLWTEQAAFTAPGLRESYANFPNPFAAGREATKFVFALPAAATVSLRLLTPHGETVMTLLDDAALAAGLYQDTVWDGRNGRGLTVANGVYLAELTVRLADGTQDRILRKVAVVR